MDRTLVYSKTPAGEEATRQRTRVVQRNLRMVLLQVDGQLDVDGLIAKIGNESLVLGALSELEKGGYIALAADAPSIWEQSKLRVKKIGAAAGAQISQISSFGPSKDDLLDDESLEPSILSETSDFGKSRRVRHVAQSKTPQAVPVPEPVPPRRLQPVRLPEQPGAEGRGVCHAGWLARLGLAKGAKDLTPIKHKSWVLRIFAGLGIVILAFFAVLLFYPYDRYRSGIESSLGKMAGMPVRVGSVGVRLLPRPSLALRDVRFGEGGETRIGMVIVPQLFSLTGSGRKIVPEVEASDVFMPADFIARLPQVILGARSSQNWAIDRVRLRGVTVAVGGATLGGLDGEIDLKVGQDPGSLSVSTVDRGLQMRFVPSISGMDVTIESQGWKPSENSPYEFSLISAKGLLRPGKLMLSNTEFGMAEGRFKGNWLFEWGGRGMTMAGNGLLSSVDVRKMLSMFAVPFEISGRLSGDLVVAGSGTNWVSMWEGTEAALSMQLDRGVLQGVDLGEATRRGAGNAVRGGSTKFDRMKGAIELRAGQVSGRNIEIDSGMLHASGQFIVKNDYSVSGGLLVTIQGSSVPIRAPLRVSGTLPVLQTAVEK